MLTKFETTISGQKYTIVEFDPDAETRKEQAEKPKLRTHYIGLIDRSGSMWGSLNSLLDQLGQTVELLKPTDKLSLIWYSGPGQFRPICIGASPSENIKKMLDNYRSTVGSTCFSEAVGEALKLLEEQSSDVDQTVAMLFTDGQPVVSWGAQEEEKRTLNVVRQMVQKGLVAFNCVGYGGYYNRPFLDNISGETQFGKTVHTSRISEFLDTFGDMVGVSGNLVNRKIDVEMSGDLVYLTSKTSVMREGRIALDRMDATVNKFYSVKGPNEIDHNFIDNKTVDIKGIKAKTSAEDKLNFFYAYAAKLYYHGKAQLALDIIVNNCKDKFLANQMINAFTADERGATQKHLDAAVIDKVRYKEGKCPAGFLPAANALCVMDVLNAIFESPEDAFYVPFSERVAIYERIGRKATDRQNVFTKADDEVRAPLNKVVWNKDYLNLSVPFKISGTVELNARDAKANNLPQIYPSFIYNTHTIVKDGNLNIKKAEFLLPAKLYEKLRSLKVPMTDIRANVESAGAESLTRVLIDFEAIPIINRTYVDNSDSLPDLHKIVTDITQTQAALRVINAEIKALYDAKPSLSKEGTFKNYTVDQIACLERHGVRYDGSYGGIDKKTASVAESDPYEVRLMNFTLKGFATLPSGKDFQAMLEGKKKINGPGAMMIAYYNDLKKRILDNPHFKDRALLDALNDEQELLKNRVEAQRNHLNMIKMAKVLTNDFFHGLTPDENGDYKFEMNEKVMVLNVARKLEYIDAAA